MGPGKGCLWDRIGRLGWRWLGVGKNLPASPGFLLWAFLGSGLPCTSRFPNVFGRGLGLPVGIPSRKRQSSSQSPSLRPLSHPPGHHHFSPSPLSNLSPNPIESTEWCPLELCHVTALQNPKQLNLRPAQAEKKWLCYPTTTSMTPAGFQQQTWTKAGLIRISLCGLRTHIEPDSIPVLEILTTSYPVLESQSLSSI